MSIPVVGIVDTNADPDLIDYVIPANDDAVGSLKLLIGYIFDAWLEGKTGVAVKSSVQPAQDKEKKVVKEEKESAEKAETEEKPKKATVKKAKKETK